MIKVSLGFFSLLALASWTFILSVDGADVTVYFSAANLDHALEFLSRLLGSGSKEVAFFNIEKWHRALALTLETLQMSIMAVGFAGIGMLLTVIPAARTTTNGTLTLSSTAFGRLVFGLIRFSYVISRAIPELIWAMLIIFVLKPGVLPGAIALGLHNFGILGKLCAEVVENLDKKPIKALHSSGAGTGQILIYGVLPGAAPKFLSYLLYRWEVIIRTTIIVGFVGAGGLGRWFKLSMSWFHYTEITLLLACYFILVILADLVSGTLRRISR